MKKQYIFLLTAGLLIGSEKVRAQLVPTTYFTFDGIAATKYKKPELGDEQPKDYSYYNPYVCKTFLSGKYQFGVFCEGVLEPDVYSVNPGLMFLTQNTEMYYEFGIGTGFEFPRDTKAEDAKKVTYLNSYLYVESVPDIQLLKGKWYGCVSFGYAPHDWGEWHMAFAMLYVSPHIAVGLHSQSYAVTGPRIQYSGLVSKNAKCTFWIAGNTTMGSVGCNFTIARNKSK